ncbi:hypothetical protein [Paenisporosarcina sp. TG-14]|uniref:hypothetical protein n=1 Tax=Paenisporosarcina sp. TG-14 TaxID=1231057 RepID=UPI0002DF68C2|nr:hypothetical protein [Paenisporosarcina sp. TG-14]
MNSRDQIIASVKNVHRRLISEHIFRVTQTALFVGLVVTAVIYLCSRLFVLPYYALWALCAGIISFGVVVVRGIFTKQSYNSSLIQFDQYFPDNLLLTALHAPEDDSGLLVTLRDKTVSSSIRAFDLFKLRKKDLWRIKSLIGIGVIFTFLLILNTFPSTTQLQAKDIEIEKELVEQIKKEVAKTIKKTASETLKKELQQLENDLKNTETTEEALRELIKKQKELQLREQKLMQKQQTFEQLGDAKSDLTAAEKKELASLKTATKDLAEQSGKTQTAISKLGKSTGNPLETTTGQTSPTNSSESNGQPESQATSQGQATGNLATPGQSANQVQGKGQGQGQGEGEGEGQGAGEGLGQGSGSGTGSGAGQGSGAGKGSGSRDLLSVPSRLGGSSQSTVDSGKIGEGSSAEETESAVPVTKGMVKPYSEVVGSYKDSYLKSSDRLQLPPDLQRIVQDYFSSLETNE